jgi:putative colanic acid biosynthesis UDP-glucose lipid carrier transferase
MITNPVVFRQRVPIGLVSLAQATLPSLIAGGLLAFESWYFEVHFSQHYTFFIALVIGLSAALLLPDRDLASQAIDGPWRQVARISMRWLLLLFLLLMLGYATKSSDEFSRRVVLSWAVAAPCLLVLATILLHQVLRRMLSNPLNSRRAAFVGYNEISVLLAERLQHNSTTTLSVVGYFDDRAPERLGPSARAQLRGSLKDIVRLVQQHTIDVIFVALPIGHINRVKQLLEDLRDTTVSIYYIPTVFPFDSIQGGTSEFLGVPLIALCETPFHGYRGVSKRMTDLILAWAILILAAPLMLLAAILIKLTSPGPVIFKQRRYGLDGQEIIIYKFRTMSVMEDGDVIRQATQRDPRVTPLGRLLRRTSIDELPQLINVLQGRMSLVGPRPHAVSHNELYRKLIKGYMVRHKVAPGITGLAQVHGLRGETATVEQMEARLKYDLEYLRNWSLLLDLNILLKTLSIVARGGKAY